MYSGILNLRVDSIFSNSANNRLSFWPSLVSSNGHSRRSSGIKWCVRRYPLLVGTLLISAVALTVAGPVGLMSAVFLSEYASSSVRSKIKPTLEILAGIPTVVYGFFAAIVVAPWLRRGGEAIGLDVSSKVLWLQV